MPTSLHRLTLRLAIERPEIRSALYGLLGEPTLEERILRLAFENEGLRPVLLDVVRKGGGTTVIPQAPIVIQQAPIVIQQAPIVIQNGQPPIPAAPVAPAPQGVPMGLINERTRDGFDVELRPELERLLTTGLTREQAAGQLIEQVNAAFREKVHLYNVLIRHQSTFETDEVFREGLVKACQVWVSEAPADGRG